MTDVLLDEEVVLTEKSDDDDDLEHYYCECNPDFGLCGIDMTDFPDHTNIETPLEDDCVVCIDLIDKPCRFCKT